MFFFLLGILGGVLAVVLGLVLVQQGKLCLDWVVRTRRSLSRPPSYNTVAKPPRYSLCGEHSQITQIIVKSDLNTIPRTDRSLSHVSLFKPLGSSSETRRDLVPG